MVQVFRQLFADFFSTLVFLAVYAITGDVLIATAVAIAGAIGQFIHARLTQQKLEFMSYAILAVVIVLGAATLLTSDPRFVLMKPSIGHFAVGLVMLKRGWMLRYMPAIVTETIPDYVTVAGYSWAALMFVLGLGNIAVALTGDIKWWAFYISVVAIGAKVLTFALQYVMFRILVTSRIRATRGAAPNAELRQVYFSNVKHRERKREVHQSSDFPLAKLRFVGRRGKETRRALDNMVENHRDVSGRVARLGC